jgi:hypothetical protein
LKVNIAFPLILNTQKAIANPQTLAKILVKMRARFYYPESVRKESPFAV